MKIYMSVKPILIATCLFLFNNQVHANELAITFDDLPIQQHEDATKLKFINEQILNALKKFNAPAMGFVNESQLYVNGQVKDRTAILKLWVDNRHQLGNHTYSHKFLSKTNIEEYKKEVIKGEKISKKLMASSGMTYRYFRHPYLDTGSTKELRSEFESFLLKKGYVVAPVTIDTDDHKFNAQLIESPGDKEKIIAQYLEHTKKKFLFYKLASEKIFGRNINHVWLLHVNLLNSYVMNDLLKIVSGLGYKFISLDQALKDSAYSEKNNYYSPFGASWLYRWDYTRGKVVDWSKEPEVGGGSFLEIRSLSFFDKSRNRSVHIKTHSSSTLKNKIKSEAIVLPIVIMINHKYSINQEHLLIENIAKELAVREYLVISIQDDTKYKSKKINIEHNVADIKFLLSEIIRMEPTLKIDQVIMVGCSDSNNAAIKFTELHPELVKKVVLLDLPLHYRCVLKPEIPGLFVTRKNLMSKENVLESILQFLS